MLCEENSTVLGSRQFIRTVSDLEADEGGGGSRVEVVLSGGAGGLGAVSCETL